MLHIMSDCWVGLDEESMDIIKPSLLLLVPISYFLSLQTFILWLYRTTLKVSANFLCLQIKKSEIRELTGFPEKFGLVLHYFLL